MKHLKFLFLFIGLTIFASCSESDVEGGIIGDANQANFSAIIGELQTRVTDNTWDAGDAIGVYALKADQSLSEAAIFEGKSNVKYTTTGNGTFSVASDPINFPETGNLDFVSYYPYKTAINDYKYSIDVTSQSNLAAIDLLYSNNAKGQNKSSPIVNLKFNHMLSKLEMNIQLGDNLTSLEGLTVGIKSVVVDGSLALLDGAITTGTTRKDITPNVKIASGNETATVAAIVVPGQNLKDVTIVFSLGGKDYKWTPSMQDLTSTYKYAYTIKLTLDDSGEPIVVPVKIGATINDWNDPQIGDDPIVLEPEEEDPVTPGEGDGTKENPYTVAQAIANQDGSEVWVKAFIVGWKKGTGDVSFSTDGASGTNIVIADNKDEDALNNTLGVALPKGDARDNLNLGSNPGMYKAEVLLQGSLEKYFGEDPGLKNVKVYVLVTPGEGGDTTTPISFTTDKSSLAFNAYTELTSTIKLTTDAVQAWTAASDASWLTLAPASGSGNANIVLTAEINTADAARTAKVTFSPTANTDLAPIVVNVTQKGAELISAGLLFPGSDFNNWATFTNSLNSFGVTFGKESATGGRASSGAMQFEGEHSANAYVFTAKVPEGFSAAGKTKINFWVKGTAVKSLSLNVYIGTADKPVMGTDYKCYNMDEHVPYNSHKVLLPLDANSYAKGGIDTGGAWIQVTLDISSLAGQINTTPGDDLFALKVGKTAAYDLFVDDITIE